MILKTHIILYVEDQQKSTDFYRNLLKIQPRLNVPGMTEFELPGSVVLGLMPVQGIKNLLKPDIEIPNKKNIGPGAELYLIVGDIENYISRAKKLNMKILSPLKERDWGHHVIYFEDLDGYIVAFAKL